MLDHTMIVKEMAKAVRRELAVEGPIEGLVVVLRQYRALGVSQEEARETLEALRTSVGEDAEDRILEMLDIVTGFCAPHLRIWGD